MTDSEIEQRLAEDLARIRDAVEAITGLSSRWNGSVVVDPFIRDAQAVFCPDGTIVAHPRLAYRKARWRTLIHEICHSVGAPVRREDYEAAKGWEEGVVEILQRAIRPETMRQLGEAYDEGHIRRVEATWKFRPYFDAMTEVYRVLEAEPIPFSVRLLQQPLLTRVAIVLRSAPRQAALLAPHFGVLKISFPSDTMTAEERELLEQEETAP